MTFRARLSLTALEARENPSTPTIDPIGGTAPPSTDPLPPPPPTDPAAVAEAAAAAGATLPSSPAPVDPLIGNNSVYKVPLLP